jgi:hypothetical protein
MQKFFTSLRNTLVSPQSQPNLYNVEAEKYLFNLKEILATETYSQSTLVSQVLWGLLACEILN